MLKQLLDKTGIRNFLKSNNLKELSKKTKIPYETLKNYSANRTNIENMSLKNVEKLTKEYIKINETFDIKVPYNLLVDENIFKDLIKKYRTNYDAHIEIAHMLEVYEQRINNIRHIKNFNEKIYFIDTNMLPRIGYPINFNILSILERYTASCLGLKIRLIICNNYEIQNNEIIKANSYESDYNIEYLTYELKLEDKKDLELFDNYTDEMNLAEVVENELLSENTPKSNLMFHALQSIKHINKYKNFNEYLHGKHDFTKYLKVDKQFNKKLDLFKDNKEIYQIINNELQRKLQKTASLRS